MYCKNCWVRMKEDSGLFCSTKCKDEFMTGDTGEIMKFLRRRGRKKYPKVV